MLVQKKQPGMMEKSKKKVPWKRPCRQSRVSNELEWTGTGRGAQREEVATRSHRGTHGDDRKVKDIV